MRPTAPSAVAADDVTLSLTQDVDASPEGVRATRGLVRSTLADWGVDAAAANAVLDVAHELLANAERHAQPPIRLTVQCTAATVLVTVTDGDPRPARRLPYRPGVTEHGLGLRLVSQLSADWGQQQTGDGKKVWAIIRRRTLGG